MARYHLDCWSGLAGDMFLGACLDLGMPLEVLEDAVARVGLPGVASRRGGRRAGGFSGTRFRVLVDGRPLEGPDPASRAGTTRSWGGSITPTTSTTTPISIPRRPRSPAGGASGARRRGGRRRG